MTPGTHTRSTDILIIGGGIIGACIALELARHRASVTICEAGTLGGEASWAGAGMLVPGSEYDERCEALDFALESLRLYPEFVAGLQEESGEEIDFSGCGSLELTDDEAEWEALQGRAQRQRSWGMRNEILQRDELRQRVPVLRQGLMGAVHYPEEGQVDPRTVMRALRSAFQRLPVVLREHSAVTRLEMGANHVEATMLSGERVAASFAVMAAGAWSSSIEAPGLVLPETFPVRGHLAGYDLEAGSLPHILRFRHTYVVQRRTGYTIAGASMEHAGFDRQVDRAIGQEVANRASSLAPGLLPHPPRDIWTGFRPGAHSAMPHVGRYQNSPLWLAYGHYRNGILLAPATAGRVSAEILALTWRTAL